MSLARLATSVLLLTLIPTAASTQPPALATPSNPETAQSTLEPNPPTIRVSAQEVVVDVLVTDSNGNAIHDLQASDFIVQENGDPQTIRSFYESSSTPPKTKPVPLPVGVFTNSRPLPAGEGPIDIFLIDHVNGNTPFDDSVIRSLPPGAPAGIFAITASGLHTVQDITTDHDLLLRALHSPVGGVILDRWQQKMTTLRALEQLAAYLSGIPGRKNMFWGLSASNPPLLLMRDGGYGWGFDTRSADMTLVHRTMDTYEMLTAARVAVYPVAFSPGSLGWGTLETEKIAEDFGTTVVYHTGNDLAPKVLAAIQNGSHYYSLSYIPPRRSFDGHYHHISVTVEKPGLTLSYRKGYDSERTPTLEDPAPGPELLKASLEGNSLNATQIVFDAAIKPLTPPTPATPAQPPPKVKPAKGAKAPPVTYRYQVVYGLPASQFSFVEDENGKLKGAVEFDVTAYNANRARVALLSQIVHMPLAWDQFDDFAASTFRFTQQIDLPPGQFWIHVGILDTVSNRVGTLEFPLAVGTPNQIRSSRGLHFGPETYLAPPDYAPPSSGSPLSNQPGSCPLPCTDPYILSNIP